jgi:hypothetical protein
MICKNWDYKITVRLHGDNEEEEERLQGSESMLYERLNWN